MARTGPRSEPTTRHPPAAEPLPAPTNTPTTGAGRAGGRPTPPPAADSDVQAAAGASSAAALSFADNLTDIPNGPSSPDDIAPGTRCGSYPSTTEKWCELRAMPRRRQLPARGAAPGGRRNSRGTCETARGADELCSNSPDCRGSWP